jgi:uncharacterized membrane protein YfcA
LLLLYPRLPIARIVGSDIAHAVPLTLLAGVGHLIMGSVNWPMVSLLIGSVPGIIVGSHASARIPDVVLRTILAITLLIVACMLAHFEQLGQYFLGNVVVLVNLIPERVNDIDTAGFGI